jgi:hypothetical protein
MANHFSKLVRNADFRRKWREDRDLAEKALSRRRERYASDPDYREKIKDSVRKRREAKQPSDQRRSFNQDKIVIINGIGVRLLSSGKTAAIIGVGARTLDLWEKKGVIPVNRAKDSLGRRWYPTPFVDFLAEHAAHRKSHRCDEWSRRVKDAWQMSQLSNHPIPIVSEHLEDNHDY